MLLSPILSLSPHLHVGLQNGLLPSVSQPEFYMHISFIPCMLNAPTYYSLLNLITLIIFD